MNFVDQSHLLQFILLSLLNVNKPLADLSYIYTSFVSRLLFLFNHFQYSYSKEKSSFQCSYPRKPFFQLLAILFPRAFKSFRTSPLGNAPLSLWFASTPFSERDYILGTDSANFYWSSENDCNLSKDATEIWERTHQLHLKPKIQGNLCDQLFLKTCDVIFLF